MTHIYENNKKTEKKNKRKISNMKQIIYYQLILSIGCQINYIIRRENYIIIDNHPIAILFCKRFCYIINIIIVLKLKKQ